MRVRTYDEMLFEFEGGRGIDRDDIVSRNEILETKPFSVIIECEHMEFDNFEKWLLQHIDTDKYSSIYYGKIGYDFGFAEYFFSNEQDAAEIRKVVPNIYTVYGASYPSMKVLKSNGYDEDINYNPEDKNAIVFWPEKKEL